MFWLLGIGFVAVVALGAQLPKTGFSCEGRTTGYYADVESGCQVYHMCDGLGRQFSYTCPNATLFQQRMLICDHWYMVNCSRSVEDYTANLRIGHKEMPFVDDSESHPYHRTPRPDLLARRTQSEYDIIYRTGRKQNFNKLNLVGVASDSKNDASSTTDEPAYNLPSHWSTEYNSQNGVTPKTAANLKKNFETSVKGKHVVALNSVTDSPVNYKSQFKATTPVFPLSVEPTSEAPGDLGLLPPIPYTARPPPLETTTNSNQVNFQSQFQATTPVFPTAVDAASEEPADAGVLPPQVTHDDNTKPVPSLNLEFEAPAVDLNPTNRTHENIQHSPPSKFYQPPKFQPDYTESQTNDPHMNTNIKVRNSEEWKELRSKFLIPDYEFPLESVSRPSYDTLFSSFQASGAKSDKK